MTIQMSRIIPTLRVMVLRFCEFGMVRPSLRQFMRAETGGCKKQKRGMTPRF